MFMGRLDHDGVVSVGLLTVVRRETLRAWAARWEDRHLSGGRCVGDSRLGRGCVAFPGGGQSFGRRVRRVPGRGPVVWAEGA